jgi:hypothetical protein
MEIIKRRMPPQILMVEVLMPKLSRIEGPATRKNTIRKNAIMQLRLATTRLSSLVLFGVMARKIGMPAIGSTIIKS